VLWVLCKLHREKAARLFAAGRFAVDDKQRRSAETYLLIEWLTVGRDRVAVRVHVRPLAFLHRAEQIRNETPPSARRGRCSATGRRWLVSRS
jgi:hypothetical protein